MNLAPRTQAILGLVLAQVVIFVVSLSGFGIETGKPSDYASWAGPIFLVLTLLVFVLGAAAIVASRGRARWLPSLVGAQAAVAIAINAFDFSGVGGPRPPVGPLILGIAALVVASLELAAVVPLLARPTSPRSHP